MHYIFILIFGIAILALNSTALALSNSGRAVTESNHTTIKQKRGGRNADWSQRMATRPGGSHKRGKRDTLKGRKPSNSEGHHGQGGGHTKSGGDSQTGGGRQSAGEAQYGEDSQHGRAG